MPPRRAGVPVKCASTDLLAQADRLEDLRAPVAHRGRDAHLRGDLEEPIFQAVQVVLAQHRRRQRLVAALSRPGWPACERQVRVDGGGAVPDQAREGCTSQTSPVSSDDVGLLPQARPDQVVVDGADGQQHRDRCVRRHRRHGQTGR